jgi:hypothetical protein
MTKTRQTFAGFLVAWLVGAAAVAGLFLTQEADAAVYWGNGNSIAAVEPGGAAADFGYFTPAEAGGQIREVAVNSRYLFWLSTSGIGRVNLDGPTVSTAVVSGIAEPCGLAVTESQIYWANCSSGSVGRANLDGTALDNSFIEELSQPCDVVVGADHIYWGDWDGIGRASLDGTGVDRSFIASAVHPCGLAVTDSHIYWSDDQRSIGRARSDGGGGEVRKEFITGTGWVTGLAADASSLYWSNRYEDGSMRATIGRASLEGTGVEQSWVTSNRIDVSGVAVDSRTSLSPLPLPSAPIHFGRVTHERLTGAVVLDVWTWKGGELTVAAPRIGWKVLNGDAPPLGPKGEVRQRLKLWPGRTGNAANHIRRQLRSRGRSSIVLRIRYVETGKTPILVRKRLVFSKRMVHGRPGDR